MENQIRASFYLVRKTYRRYPFVQQGDYVVKLPNNKCFKLKEFTQAQGTFQVEDKIPLDMTQFSHAYIENAVTSHPRLVELAQ